MGQIQVTYDLDGIQGLCTIESAVHVDSRGYFMETFSQKEHDYTQEELDTLAALNNMVAVICSENSLTPSDGKVIFLNAMKNSTDGMMKDKTDALRFYAPKAEIHDFPDHSHSGIFSDEQLHPFYDELAKKLLADNGAN